MALSQIYNAVAGDVITAARWNNEFGNIYTNGTDVAFPVTKAVSFNGFTLTLDAAGVSTLISTASVGFVLTAGSKSGAPGLNGSFFNLVVATFTDTDTAGSGTATQFSGTTFRAPTLAATNTLVTTTDAATVSIEGAPSAGTNETITNSWALRVVAGSTRLGGDVSVGGNTVLNGTLALTGKSAWLAKGANIASAGGGTTDIWSTDGNIIHITGTNTITSLGSAPQAGAHKLVIFDGALTLTHGANLLLPGAANIVTAANDTMLVVADTTTQLDILYYTKASGLPVVDPPASLGSSWVLIETETASASADLVFDNLGSTYDEHIFQLIDVIPGTNAAEMVFEYSVDNGANYANSSYTSSSFGVASAAQIQLAVNQSSNIEFSGLNGWVHLYKPHLTSKQKQVKFTTCFVNSGNAVVDLHGTGKCADTSPDVIANAVNAIRFVYNAGTLASGVIRHFGIKNS